MSRKMKTVIDYINSRENSCVVYGFGSFFRGESTSRDIDLLFVCEMTEAEMSAAHRRIQAMLAPLAVSMDIDIDYTLLTPTEFSDFPFRNREDFALIVKRQ